MPRSTQSQRTTGSDPIVYSGRGRPPKAYLAQQAKEAASQSEYTKALNNFRAMIETQRNTIEEFAGKPLSIITIEPGRRFDRVLSKQEHHRAEVIFFVEREGGTIYGPKSDIAPNERHWFDTVYTAPRWIWAAISKTGAFWPEPRDPSQYRESKEYGGYRHFEPIKGKKKQRAA